MLAADTVFAEFYREQFASAARLAYLLTGSSDVAEDIAQESLLAVESKLPTLHEPRAYLRATIVNRVADLRRRELRRARRLECLYTAGHVDPPTREVADVLGRLPERQRTALVLRYWLGLANAEIGETMGCPEGTVKSLISRGLDRLRVELGES